MKLWLFFFFILIFLEGSNFDYFLGKVAFFFLVKIFSYVLIVALYSHKISIKIENESSCHIRTFCDWFKINSNVCLGIFVFFVKLCFFFWWYIMTLSACQNLEYRNFESQLLWLTGGSKSKSCFSVTSFAFLLLFFFIAFLFLQATWTTLTRIQPLPTKYPEKKKKKVILAIEMDFYDYF